MGSVGHCSAKNETMYLIRSPRFGNREDFWQKLMHAPRRQHKMPPCWAGCWKRKKVKMPSLRLPGPENKALDMRGDRPEHRRSDNKSESLPPQPRDDLSIIKNIDAQKGTCVCFLIVGVGIYTIKPGDVVKSIWKSSKLTRIHCGAKRGASLHSIE